MPTLMPAMIFLLLLRSYSLIDVQIFEKKILSSLLGKNYIKSDTLHDTTEKFYSSWNRNRDNQIKTLEDFPFELELGSVQNIRPNRAEIENPINEEEKQKAEEEKRKAEEAESRAGKAIERNYRLIVKKP